MKKVYLIKNFNYDTLIFESKYDAEDFVKKGPKGLEIKEVEIIKPSYVADLIEFNDLLAEFTEPFRKFLINVILWLFYKKPDVDPKLLKLVYRPNFLGKIFKLSTIKTEMEIF